uniref:alpha/beta hydrolase n=1 Tax=Acinetobacter variabilis TaxID=70346 RepID=UPI0039184662
MRFFVIHLLLLCSIILAGCQNTIQNSRVIAGAFNLTTGMQQKVMDRYAPGSVIVHQNMVYEPQKKLSLDLYQPQNIENIGPQPTIVWIHGGGWISGSKEHARGYFKLLAAQGYNVVSV